MLYVGVKYKDIERYMNLTKMESPFYTQHGENHESKHASRKISGRNEG